MNNLPIVALVGPPNAGKSTLLNKIAGNSVAVTSEVAGTTRDRQYLETMWNGTPFMLVDTAGLSIDATGELEENVSKQTDIAFEEADVVVLVLDGRQNRLSIDQPILHKFRKSKKPLLLVVNKLDSAGKAEEKLSEFASLGIKPTFGISSLTGRGIGDMLDYIVSLLATAGNGLKPSPTSATTINVSIVGKPNVGKSSLFNAILKEDRVVVSAVPGTTRTAIDEHMNIAGVDYTFIDTAGLKKKTHRQDKPDIYSGFQTFKAIRRSDVCLFVIDSIEEITKQDQRVAQEIFELEKGCVILANKIDVYDGDKEKLQDYISLHFPFLWMCPLFFVSGKTGKGLEDALQAIQPIYERRHKTTEPEDLQKLLDRKMKANPPKLLRDQKKPKVYCLKQLDINQPLFELVVNHPAAISMQFRKFVENSIIKELDYWGTPITLRLKGKDKA